MTDGKRTLDELIDWPTTSEQIRLSKLKRLLKDIRNGTRTIEPIIDQLINATSNWSNERVFTTVKSLQEILNCFKGKEGQLVIYTKEDKSCPVLKSYELICIGDLIYYPTISLSKKPQMYIPMERYVRYDKPKGDKQEFVFNIVNGGLTLTETDFLVSVLGLDKFNNYDKIERKLLVGDKDVCNFLQIRNSYGLDRNLKIKCYESMRETNMRLPEQLTRAYNEECLRLKRNIFEYFKKFNTSPDKEQQENVRCYLRMAVNIGLPWDETKYNPHWDVSLKLSDYIRELCEAYEIKIPEQRQPITLLC